MAIGPAHTYTRQGLKKGIDEKFLESIHLASLELKSHFRTYVHSLGHLAHCSKVNYHYLRKIVEREIACYEIYPVPKRSGGSRYISAPQPPLKEAQRWINKFILADFSPHWRCYSYRKDVSTIDAAREHCEAKWLVKIDIENFFDSVSEEKVYEFFKSAGYNRLLSFELSRVCTISPAFMSTSHFKNWILFNKTSAKVPYKRKGIKFIGRLPQGAPTSPMLSNLLFKDIDILLQEYAVSNGLVYTRYADDLCFSSGKKDFGRENCSALISFCEKLLRSNGYATNKVKTKIIPPGALKVILGLNVNHYLPKLPKSFKKRLESHIRGCDKFGVVNHSQHKKFQSTFAMIDHIHGLLNYAKTVDKDYAQSLILKFNSVKVRDGFV